MACDWSALMISVFSSMSSGSFLPFCSGFSCSGFSCSGFSCSGYGPGGERDLGEGGQGLGSQLQLPQGEGEGHPRAGPCGEETVALQSSSWHSPSLPHCRGLCTRRQTHKLKLVLETEISSGPSRRYCNACVRIPCPVPILCYLPCSKLRSSARQ